MAGRWVWGGRRMVLAVRVGGLGVAGVVVGWWVWGLAGVLLVGGAFARFEARRGGCILRAMGIRTPM